MNEWVQPMLLRFKRTIDQRCCFSGEDRFNLPAPAAYRWQPPSPWTASKELSLFGFDHLEVHPHQTVGGLQLSLWFTHMRTHSHTAHSDCRSFTHKFSPPRRQSNQVASDETHIHLLSLSFAHSHARSQHCTASMSASPGIISRAAVCTCKEAVDISSRQTYKLRQTSRAELSALPRNDSGSKRTGSEGRYDVSQVSEVISAERELPKRLVSKILPLRGKELQRCMSSAFLPATRV